jgi:hypothetical protein
LCRLEHSVSAGVGARGDLDDKKQLIRGKGWRVLLGELVGKHRGIRDVPVAAAGKIDVRGTVHQSQVDESAVQPAADQGDDPLMTTDGDVMSKCPSMSWTRMPSASIRCAVYLSAASCGS